MIKILFVCHGNICRSPMAEFVMSREEIGNDVYPPARRTLVEHGISCPRRAARQLTRADFEEYDLIIGMDSENERGMRRICGDGDAEKIHLLMDYTDRPGDVADPWYTRVACRFCVLPKVR